MLRRDLFAVMPGLALLGAAGAASAKDAKQDEDAIRKLVHTELEGGQAHDVDKVMSVYWNSKDFVLFDPGPKIVRGYDALKEAWIAYFKVFSKAEATLDELHVGASGDVGYAMSLQTWTFYKPDGTFRKDEHRVTNIYRKIDGRWVCILESDAVPVDLKVL